MRTWDIEKEGSRIRMTADAASKTPPRLVLPPRRLFRSGRRSGRDVDTRHRSRIRASSRPLARARKRKSSSRGTCAKSSAPSSMPSGWLMADAKARVGASSARPRRRAAVLQVIAAAVAHVLIIGGAASADTSCRQGQSFGEWLAAFRGEAAAAGYFSRNARRARRRNRRSPRPETGPRPADPVPKLSRFRRPRRLRRSPGTWPRASEEACVRHSRRSSGTLAFPVR